MGKRLGQHFLVNSSVAERIVTAARVQPDDVVLEIGPGKGVLTHLLAQKAKHVIAIEKDKNLVIYLKNRFEAVKNIEIIEQDILKYSDVRHRYIIVANLPYYITSRFLRLFLEEMPNKPISMTLMVQKEVAERICAKPPNMNLLALSVQAFGKPKILFTVGKGNFSPPPEVESAVIQISDISDNFFKKHGVTPKEFFTLPRKTFSQKRKMLRSSLQYAEVRLPQVYTEKRPQELGLEEWSKLWKILRRGSG